VPNSKQNNIATLASTIALAVNNRLKDLHTSMPGIIESFDPATQLVTVQPAIKRIFITTETDKEILVPVDIPLLINVPVCFPRGGGFSLTFPVTKGDECLLVFCERSIDNWHQFGGVKEPIARRFHALSDAIAYVGLSSLPNKVPDYSSTDVELKKDDGSSKITIAADGTMTLKTDVKVTVDTPDAEFTGNLKVLGNLEVVGETALSETVTSNSKDISDTHTHIGSATAPTGPKVNTGVVV